jgi:hypothetical protein
MEDMKKFIQRNLRRIIAGMAILCSLLAFSALASTPQGVMVWQVTSTITSGSRIQADQVQLTHVSFSQNQSHFFGSKDAVVGRYADRLLVPGDLIATSDIASRGTSDHATFLPIGVLINDLPIDLNVGDRVDIYVIPKDSTLVPAVVAKGISVQSIDQKSRALGGEIGVSISTNSQIASEVVTAEAQGRLVLARESF